MNPALLCFAACSPQTTTNGVLIPLGGFRAKAFFSALYISEQLELKRPGTVLRKIPTPLVAICDGGTGVRAALREQWPDTLTQRCIFHVWMNLRTHLTLRPRTPAGQALLEIGKQLRRVTTVDEAVTWLQQLSDWHTVYGHLTRERSYAKRRLRNRLWDSPTGEKWWYTHDRLRKAYNLLAELQRREHLFTFLMTGGPKTTSRLEGGVNAMIKQTLRLHRCMTIEHQKRAAEWVLIQRTGLLHTASGMVTKEAVTPRVKQRPQFTESDPGPVLYDHGISAEEGLWTRSGWAGRGLHAQRYPHVLAGNPGATSCSGRYPSLALTLARTTSARNCTRFVSRWS